MDACLTPDGRFDRAAIMRLANANIAAARRKYGLDFDRKVDVALAFKSAWARARAEKTRFDARNGRGAWAVVSAHTARELATDGRISA